MTEEIYDVIIIGGGPSGLSAAQYASRSRLKTIVLDKSPDAGALAYSSKIENYPGLIEPLSGKELLDLFRNQAIKFGAEYKESKVTGVKLEPDTKEIYTAEDTYMGKAVIIATGSMGRTAAISGEKEFLGKGVSYCAVCDAAFFKDQVVCVVGDNEEALKEAGVLARFASKVILISHRKSPIEPGKHSVHSTPNISYMNGYQVVSIEGTALVEQIRVKDIESGKELVIQTAGVFIYLQGNKPVVDFLDDSVKLGEHLCVTANRLMETSIPGVYASGDVSCNEIRQVVLAAANGCIAALAAEKYLNQRKRLKQDWAKAVE